MEGTDVMRAPQGVQHRGPAILASAAGALLGRAATASPEAGWVSWITRVAIVAPLPYSLSRLLWAVGIPVGIHQDALRNDLQSPGWGSIGMLVLILLAEGTSIYTHLFVGSRRPDVPAWIPFLGGRRVRPLLVIAPLLTPIWILSSFNYWTLPYIADGFAMPGEVGEDLPPWSFWLQVATFWVWGVALAIATARYWYDTRGWAQSRRGDARSAA